MTPTLHVHDTIAELVDRRRAALCAATGWNVYATNSRNELLARVRAADARDPVFALIDLVDDDRIPNRRLGDRIIATIARNEELRVRCIPIALTAYAGDPMVHSAVHRAGARAVIYSMAIATSTLGDRALTTFLEKVRRHHREDAQRPVPQRSPLPTYPEDRATGTMLPDAPTQDAVAEEYRRWFDTDLRPWTLLMLEAIATHGEEQKDGVAWMRKKASEEDSGVIAGSRRGPLSEGTLKNNYSRLCQTLRETTGRPAADAAAQFLAYVKVDLRMSPAIYRLPSFQLLRDAVDVSRDPLVRWAAFVSAPDLSLARLACDADNEIRSEVGGVARDPAIRLDEACRRAASTEGTPRTVLEAASGFVAHAINDAREDYLVRPAIEISHRLKREIDIPFAIKQKARRAGTPQTAGVEARLTCGPDGIARVDGLTAEQWAEQPQRRPHEGVLAALKRISTHP